MRCNAASNILLHTGRAYMCRHSRAVALRVCPVCRAHSVLHRYRASEGIQVPFKVIPMVKELGRTRMEANVSVRSLFGAKLFALNTVVRGADVPAVVCVYTCAADQPTTKGCAWGRRLGKLPGFR